MVGHLICCQVMCDLQLMTQFTQRIDSTVRIHSTSDKQIWRLGQDLQPYPHPGQLPWSITPSWSVTLASHPILVSYPGQSPHPGQLPWPVTPSWSVTLVNHPILVSYPGQSPNPGQLPWPVTPSWSVTLASHPILVSYPGQSPHPSQLPWPVTPS